MTYEAPPAFENAREAIGYGLGYGLGYGQEGRRGFFQRLSPANGHAFSLRVATDTE